MRKTFPAAVAVTVAIATVAGCGTTAAVADPLTGTTWRLVSIESMASEQPPIAIDGAVYTLAFGDSTHTAGSAASGKAALQVDCNRGSAAWQATAAAPDSGSLSFGPVALTRMNCPKPAQDNKVVTALGEVRSYLIADGQLHLSLAVDTGIMHWAPTR